MRDFHNFSYGKSSPILMGTGDNQGFNFKTMETPEETGERIRKKREELGWSQQDLANKLRLSQPAIKKIEDGTTRKSKHLWQIMGILGIPMPDGEVTGTPEKQIISGERIIQQGSTFPVYASAQGGPGEIIRSAEPVDWVPRPTAVANVRDAYGLIVVGDSMEHELEAGDTVYINPHLPIVFGKTYVFYHEKDGEARATVKRLVKSNAKNWIVAQRNPKKEFELPKSEWSIAHRVVGKLYG
jgi:phage repressor protein C with HTH and peptisase S24 domain